MVAQAAKQQSVAFELERCRRGKRWCGNRDTINQWPRWSWRSAVPSHTPVPSIATVIL